MRFLMDANMPQSITSVLTAMGHEVEEVLAWNAGADDLSVLSRAREQNSILITADLWFGNIQIHPVSSYPGMIIVRPKNLRPEEVIQLVSDTVRQYDESLRGKLIIVDKNQIRVRE